MADGDWLKRWNCWLSLVAVLVGAVFSGAATAQGPAHLVADIFPGIDPLANSNPQNFILMEGFVLFLADDGAHGGELWRSDGSAAGTMLVKDINPGRASSAFSSNVAAINGVGYFVADDGLHGDELWRSDGTAAGTRMVKDLNPGPNGSGPHFFFVVGSTLYFAAHDDATGIELWRSDGSAAGTVQVADINLGPGDSSPANFILIGDTLFFAAADGIHGCELWRSDGTDAGTRLVKDTSPSPECYDTLLPGPYYWRVYLGPQAMTDVGGALFFIADHTL